MEPDHAALSGRKGAHFVLRIDADSTDEELEALADAIVDWIKARDPDLFLLEDD